MYVIHDHITLKTYECEDLVELKETLESVFGMDEDGAPRHVQAAINTIVCNIGHGYVGDEEEFLNISIEKQVAKKGTSWYRRYGAQT